MKSFRFSFIVLICVCSFTSLIPSCKKRIKPDTASSPPGGGTDTIKVGTGTDTVKSGTDQTVYLSQAANVMLVGNASSGDSYAWTKIYDVQPPQAGYPTDPAIITSPSSATTSVTGLIQGVWYYQLAVTSGGTTKYDTTVIRVDNDVPPVGGTYFRGLPITNQKLIDSTDSRYDTTHDIEGEVDISEGAIFFNRARLPEMMIDSSRGKFYSTVEDGYGWHGSGGNGTYARTELHLQGSTWNNGMGLDSNKTYCFEWKGYFPQDFRYLKENQTVGGLFQIHANDGVTPLFGFAILYGIDGSNASRGTPGVYGLYAADGNDLHLIEHLDSMVNQTHTIRVTIREGLGYPGQDAFYKVQVDGVQRYFRNTGKVGATFQEDYPKLATVYDYGNALVDPGNPTRGRKFSLVTESFKIYEIK